MPCTVVSTRGSGRGLRYVVVVATEAEEQHIVLPKSRVMEASGRGRRRGARLRRVSRGQSRPGLRVGLPRHRHGRQGGQRGQSHLLPHQRHLGRRHAGSGWAIRPALPYLRERDCGVLQRRAAAADEDGAVHGGLARRHTTYKIVTELTGGHERKIMLPVTEVQRQSLEKTRPEGRE